MRTSMVVRIGYRDVFGVSAKIKKEQLLSKLDIESSLELMAVINKYEHKLRIDDDSEIKFILRDLLSSCRSDLKDKIFSCFARLASKHAQGKARDYSRVGIINRLSTLRVIELLIAEAESRPVEKRNAGSSAGEEMLLFYLLVNDELAERQDVPFEKYLATRKLRGHESRLHLYLGLSHTEVTGDNASKKLISASLTFVLLERWLKTNADYAYISKQYLEGLGHSDWYNLYTQILHISNIAIDQHKIHRDLYPELITLLDYFSNHSDSSTYWRELTGLRRSPLYRNASGDYLVLDFSFMLDKFFAGLYHDLIALSNRLPKNNFHQDYSKDFMEHTLLTAAVKACMGKSYIQYNEESILSLKVKGINSLALPDYYIRNGNKVILFECKNSYISNAAKISFSTEQIEKEIVDKFVGNESKKKAVRQLLSFIENSNAGKYAFFDNMKNLRRVIYFPVLIVSDPTLTAMGFNAFLAESMEDYEEALDPALSKRIQQLTLIHINDLLYYASNLKKLDSLIISYHEFLAKQQVPDKMVSFSTYLDHHKLKGARNIRRADVAHIVP